MTKIVHKQCGFTYIICVKPFNLKVIDFDRAFEDLVLHFFDYYIFAIYSNENIPSTEFTGSNPTLYGRVERLFRWSKLIDIFLNMLPVGSLALKEENLNESVLLTSADHNFYANSDDNLKKSQHGTIHVIASTRPLSQHDPTIAILI